SGLVAGHGEGCIDAGREVEDVQVAVRARLPPCTDTRRVEDPRMRRSRGRHAPRARGFAGDYSYGRRGFRGFRLRVATWDVRRGRRSGGIGRKRTNRRGTCRMRSTSRHEGHDDADRASSACGSHYWTLDPAVAAE